MNEKLNKYQIWNCVPLKSYRLLLFHFQKMHLDQHKCHCMEPTNEIKIIEQTFSDFR